MLFKTLFGIIKFVNIKFIQEKPRKRPLHILDERVFFILN